MNRIGLLPLYLELYDRTCSFMRPRIEKYLDRIASLLEARGMSLIRAPICRLHDEFERAVSHFEEEGACAIVTLHLAYSPSLECIDALIRTTLPIIVLDTTESMSFDPSISADEILYNHGIHGVQDMCSLLKRNGRKYEVFAGHFEKSDVLDRVVRSCRGARIAAAFRSTRVGIIGRPFEGMGDFIVPFEALRRDFGIDVVQYSMDEGADRIRSVSEKDIEREREMDRSIFECDESLESSAYEKSTRVGLGIRSWMAEEGLTAFTINFMATEGSHSGLTVMPFVECGKAMHRGIGYAGEGDVLTAAFCGAVLQIHPETTFTEMFCPDWVGGSVFLSHMGELNYRTCVGRPSLKEMDFRYTSADNTLVAYGTMKPGPVVFANLAPMGDSSYSLILAAGEIVAVERETALKQSIQGWFRPALPLPEFLEAFSRAGGTHHSIVIYNGCIREMAAFALAMGFDCITIE